MDDSSECAMDDSSDQQLERSMIQQPDRGPVMSMFSPSRRDAIKSLGGSFIAGTFGIGTHLDSASVLANELSESGKVVDTHVHIVSSRLYRMGVVAAPTPPFHLFQEPGGAARLAKMLEDDMKAAGVSHALCMPSAAISDKDPLGIQPTLTQATLIKGPKLHPIGIAHPERFDPDHMNRVEDVMKQGQVKALKAYLGYMHYTPTNPGYRPYYRLAAKYNIPVIFHTGDTNSPIAKVKYAHPLQIDEIAVDFPDTKFVLAHFGNPWIMDAAQVVYKNENVYAEMSAFLVGTAEDFATMEKDGVLARTVKRIQEGIEFAEAPDRFVFGSDWPLSPIPVYRDFVRQIFPSELHEAVFQKNAKKLYGLT
jgi:predicted TIM-barrel fold metal-dependent hydrolase